MNRRNKAEMDHPADSKFRTLHINVSTDFYEQIAARATREHRSISQMAKVMLIEAAQQSNDQPTPAVA